MNLGENQKQVVSSDPRSDPQTDTAIFLEEPLENLTFVTLKCQAQAAYLKLN